MEREDEEEDVSSYYLSLRKRDDTEIWNRKHWITLLGKLAFERLWVGRNAGDWFAYY